MAKIKVGIAGCGVMGRFHVKTALALTECSLVGIFDSNQDIYPTLSLGPKVKLFASFDEMLENVSAVIIATPTSTHYDFAFGALNKHKHLLVEKPLTLDSSSSKTLVDKALASNLILSVGMIERFNPAFIKLRALVKNDKILGIDISRFSPFPERISDASVILDMMIHDIDLAALIGNTAISQIKASGEKIKSQRLDEANATLYFKDGLIAKLSASRCKNEKLRRIIITTDKGIYEADLLNKKISFRDYATLGNNIDIQVTLADQLTAEQKDFFNAISKGRPSKSPGEDAIRAISVAEEIEKQCLYQ